MKLIFNIQFNTRPGQDVYIKINGESMPMKYAQFGKWTLTLEDSDYRTFDYSYFVTEGTTTMFEAGTPRHNEPGEKNNLIEFNDQWQGFDDQTPFLTTPFTEVFNRHAVSYPKLDRFSRNIVIRATIPNTGSEETILICGNTQQLGEWDTCRAPKMKYVGGARWEAVLNYEQSIEYKFIRESSHSSEWECGANHRLFIPSMELHSTKVFEHSSTGLPHRRPRIAGTAIPVFSLRSRNSWGVGDFSDIKLMVDWAVKTRQKILQLLPVNDTTSSKTWTDSYPYGGITIMALHPLYLDLSELGTLKDKTLKARFEKERKFLNALELIDYERVMKLKMDYAAAMFEQDEDKLKADLDLKAFIEVNKDWLLPYATFCYLRDKNGTADFTTWGKWATYDAVKAETLLKKQGTRKEMLFHCYIQFHLDKQLRASRDYAHQHSVAIKGDIPIGITRHSVEAWKEPHYFNMDSQAGAPPDFFSADGQNWGFPTYNWDSMASDGYLWWKKRFTKMAEYFDAYRIDHVLGFFRIWEIPSQYKSGIMGHFAPALPYSKDELIGRGMNLDLFLEDPHKPGYFHPRIDSRGKGGYAMDALYDDYFYSRHNEFWKNEAKKKLPAIMASTNMLTCAEDLGMIPSCVPKVLEDLKVLTLEIQRMPKDSSKDLGNPSEFPYMCVCSTGSHDTSTLRGWWGERNNWQECPVETCKWIIAEHLHSPAMMAIMPWQDWTSIDENVRAADTSKERINDPANPKHYWRYRMHIFLEDLLKMDEFNAKVGEMINQSGR